MHTTVISTTATRATRTPMTAPSAVLLILVVLSSCEVVVGDTLSVVVIVRVFDKVGTLFVAVAGCDCVQILILYYLTRISLPAGWHVITASSPH